MRSLKLLGAEIALGLLLNLTAALFDKPLIVSITRWGWLLVALHVTYILASSQLATRASIKLRSRFGRHAMISYVIVGLAFAGVGVAYWKGINAGYARLLANSEKAEPPVLDTTSGPETTSPAKTPEPPPVATGPATTFGDNSPAVTGSGNTVVYGGPSNAAEKSGKANK